MNRTRVLLRAGVGAVGLSALLIGLPALLLSFIGNPLPRHVATWSQVQLAVQSGNIAQQTILRVIALVLWCIWAWLVWSAVGEVRGAVQAHRAGRLIGGHRIVMGRLVVPIFTAAFILLGRAPTPSFAAPLPAVAAAPVVAAATPAVNGHSLGVVVAPGDTLPGIATRVLGSPDRAPQLFQVNRGVLQADGGRLSDPSELTPGWRLALPVSNGIIPGPQVANADYVSAPAAPGEEVLTHHVVLKDECLSEIAEHYYHDGALWGPIAKANPDVISHPNLIYPGQVLVIPALSNGNRAATLPVPSTNSGPPPSLAAPAPTSPKVQSVAPAVPNSTAQAPGVHNDVKQPAGDQRTPSTPRPLSSTSAPHSGESDPGHSAQAAGAHRLLAGEVLLAALLAAGVIRTLMFLRRRQQRRVPLDRRPPQPGPLLVPTEVALRRAADTKNLGRLEAALAGLSIGLASRDGEVATVLGVVVETDGRVKVCLGGAQDDAPEPFTALEGGEVWELGPGAPLGEDLDEAEPLMPALVGVGRTATGQEVLVNLEAFGSIALVGPGGPALLRSWVTELGTKPWSECLEIVPVGFADELAGLERVQPAATLEAVCPSMVVHARQVTEMVEDVGETSLLAARLHGSADNWAPQVVCCAEAPTRQELDPVRLALADSARSGVVLAAAGPMSEAGLVLDTSTDEMEVAPLGMTVRPHGLAASEVASIGGLVDVAQSHDDVGPDDPAYDTEVSPTRAARELLDPAAYFDKEGLDGNAPADDEWGDFDLASTGKPSNGHRQSPDQAGLAGPGKPEEPTGSALDSMAYARELAAEVLDLEFVAGRAAGEPPPEKASPPEPVSGVSSERPEPVAQDEVRQIVAAAECEIEVLGPVVAGGLEGKAKEIATYLALHPEGVKKRVLIQAMWPGDVRCSDKTFRNMVTAVRAGLGKDGSGAPYLPPSVMSTYQASEAMGTNWGRFSKLVALAKCGNPEHTQDYLREALSLVKGEPFVDAGPKSFEWIQGPLASNEPQASWVNTMTTAIAEASCDLAEACQAVGDLPGAAWALDRGLLACSTDERLVAMRIRAAQDAKEARVAFEEFLRVSDDDVGDDVLAAYLELCQQPT